MQSIITFKKILKSVAVRGLSLFLLFAFSLTGVKAQTTITTNFPVNNGNGFVTFNFTNNNATGIVITNVGSVVNLATGNADVSGYYKPGAINGAPGAISAANGWIQFGSATVTANGAGTIQPFFSSSLVIPAGATYGICVNSFTAGTTTGALAYSTLAAGTYTFPGGGAVLTTGTNIGYAGAGVPNAPANTPRGFVGSVTFTAAVPCSGTPAPGATNSTANSACATIPFTLSPANATAGTGVTYQWQSSSTGVAGSFTNIAGATSSTYTTSLTASTYYQVVVTCGGNSATSTPKLVTLTPASQCYCIPTASTFGCNSGDRIDNVTIGGINNNSLCGNGGTVSGYSNYTIPYTIPAPSPAVPAGTVLRGASNPISVNFAGGFQEFVGVWIDYDQSGTFDANEFTALGSSTTGGPLTGSIVVPATALLGNTRMRVKLNYAAAIAPTSACTGSGFGEIEDYNVTIQNCVPTTFTSQPANTSAVCAGNATFTVAVTGSFPSYQWQYRVNATSPWLTVTNTPPYSGANTASLTITGVTAAMSGYQYRVIVSGACTGADFSDPATLTVTSQVAVLTPASVSICAGAIQALSLTNTLGNSITINEGFNAGIPAGWATQNRSVPIGTVAGWLQGSVAAAGYPAFSGAPNSFVYSDFNAANQTGVPNTISNWLFTPSIGVKNGDILTFYTRQPGGTDYPDRLEVRLSANGPSTNVGATATSVGDFTTLLLTINPTVITGVYPKVWTQFTVTVSGLAAPVTGRLAFRVFTPDNGTGSNQNQVGLDDVVFTSTGNFAQGVFTTISPVGGPNTIFTDANATIAYTGTPTTTVYVNPTVNTVYSVTYTTPGGCVSTTTLDTVKVNTPALGSPTLSNTSVCVGSNTFLKLGGTLTGGPGFVHNFQVKAPGATTFTNITAGGVYSFNADTLKLRAVPLSFNGYQFRDSINTGGNCGSVISTVATLSVNPIPVVTISAAPRVNLFPGITTTLTAAVSSATPPVTYQWFRNGVAVNGATNNTLVVGIDGLGSYTVRATAQGCSSADSTTTPKTITIGDSAGVTTLFIYPSPNSGKFQVRYFSDINNGAKSPAMINVFDEKGAKVFTQYYGIGAGYQQMNVDLGTHGRGIYRVELTDLNGDRIKTGSVMVF